MLSTQGKRTNAKIYKWEDYEMGKKNKSVQNTNETSQENQNKNVLNVSKSTVHVLGWILGLSIPIFATVIGFLGVNLYSINGTVSSLSAKVDNINASLEQTNTELGNMQKELYEKDGVYSRLTAIETVLNMKVLAASSNITSCLDKADIQQNDSTITTAPIDSNAVIGTDSDGKAYIADELINQTIILTYNDEGKEVYFLGQYDENYRWNGYCVTNAYYPDGTLYGICESNFDDGTRLDYKSFVATDTPNEWVYSDKICSEESNAGKNILYSLVYDRTKNFTTTNVRTTDIMYPDDFVNQNNPRVLKYYNGNTVNGKYEDNTGNAYYISFNEDGTIKTLYVGQFSNGTFNDNTGEAWDISYSEESRNYIYNKGIFKDGNATNCTSEIYDMDQINTLIANRDFDCELKWKE